MTEATSPLQMAEEFRAAWPQVAAPNMSVLAESKIAEQFAVDAAAIESAKVRYSTVDAATKEGYALAIEGRALFRDTRIAIDKRRKELNADANAYTKRVNSVAKQLTELVSPTEDALNDKIHKVDEAKAIAKQAEREAAEAAERARLREEQESERARMAEEREAIELEKKALADLRAKQEAETQARREQEELERKGREEAERKRLQELAARLALLARLHNTGMPGCAYDDTCATTAELTRAPIPEFADMPLQRLESLTVTKELAAKELREAKARREQTEREQAEAEELRKAQARDEEQRRLNAERAELDKQRTQLEAEKRRQREHRFGLLIRLVNLTPDYPASALWTATGNNVEVDDEVKEPFASMAISELESLVGRLELAWRQELEARRASEAEERRVAELERKAALEKRREALRPDCEKLRIYAESIRTVPIPEFSDDADVTGTINTTIDALLNIAEALDKAADAIDGSSSNAAS